jgi:pyridoxal phosphate enzyme (YggS family)
VLLNFVKEKIRSACKDSSPLRSEHDVTLIAVSKTHPAEKIVPLLEDGHIDFGENKVQEAFSKWPELKAQYPNTKLHLIGPLQTNKARTAFDLFDVIHTLDREKLARKFADLLQEKGTCPDIFIQINIGEESQKSGLPPEQTDDFVTACRDIYGLPVIGLMAIPPLQEDPVPYFKKLAELAKRNDLSQLSMGMSADFEDAIKCGATHIRVGSALFGERQTAT